MGKQVCGVSNLENRSKAIGWKNTFYSCLWLEDEIKVKNNSCSSSAYMVIYLELIYKYYSATTNPINSHYKLFAVFKYWGRKFSWLKLEKEEGIFSQLAVNILLN